jgi:hypothetical protein
MQAATVHRLLRSAAPAAERRPILEWTAWLLLISLGGGVSMKTKSALVGTPWRLLDVEGALAPAEPAAAPVLNCARKATAMLRRQAATAFPVLVNWPRNASCSGLTQ